MADITELSTELKFVARWGENVVLSMAGLFTSALLYGIYVILFCASLLILCRREGSVKARITLLTIITAMFIISTFEVFLDLLTVITGIQNVLVDNIQTSFIQKQAAFGERFALVASVEEVIGPLEIVLGDAIVFWRVWVLCAGERKLVLVPFIFLLATTACTLGFLGCFAQNNWPIVNPPTCNSLIIAVYVFSMASNISGTTLVGIKFWAYRENVGSHLGKHNKGRAGKILVLLLESGIVYSLIWVVQLVLVRMPPSTTFSGQIVQQIFRSGTVQLVGIYPTLVIVLVYMQRSLWDVSGNSTLVGSPVSSSTRRYRKNETENH